MSKEERFLLHLPCVNSFVAQRLLSVTTLREICRMARDEMLSTCKALNIPTKIAQVSSIPIAIRFKLSDDLRRSVDVNHCVFCYETGRLAQL